MIIVVSTSSMPAASPDLSHMSTITTYCSAAQATGLTCFFGVEFMSVALTMGFASATRSDFALLIHTHRGEAAVAVRLIPGHNVILTVGVHSRVRKKSSGPCR